MGMSSKSSKHRVLNRQVFYPGDNIVRQGDDGMRAYLIEHGHADVLIKDGAQELKVAELGNGDIFGEMSLIVKDVRSATVRAQTECVVTVISNEDFEKKIDKITDPATKSIIRILVQRLKETTQGHIKHYISVSDFNQRINSIVDRVSMDIRKEKRTEFQADIKPVLEQLTSVLEKYSQTDKN